MALSDLKVYSEYAYETMTEVQDQQIRLFNQASGGTIVLRPSAHQGDFSDETFFKKITGGTTRRRNAYGSGAISQATLQMAADSSVKVATGTPEFLYQPSDFKWIQINPEAAGIAFGIQLAEDNLRDMLNVAIGAAVSAVLPVTANYLDVSALTGGLELPSFQNLVKTAGKLGDRQTEVAAWVMHSNSMTQLYLQQVNNAERLFSYGNIIVSRDPFGRLLIQTDSPQLQGASSTFYTLGLQPGAIYVGQNNDFTAMERNITGSENLQLAYQAEWSFQLGLRGFTWDKANGGASPTNSALFTSTNWDKTVTSDKDILGVLLKTK